MCIEENFIEEAKGLIKNFDSSLKEVNSKIRLSEA